MTLKNDLLFSIEGKKIIVAGACGDFGKEISQFLYERGAKLFLIDRNKQKLEKLSLQLKGTVYFSADISSENQMKKLLNVLGPRFFLLKKLFKNY